MLPPLEKAVLSLRPAIGVDASALAIFGARAFLDTFGGDPNHGPEDMTVYLSEAFAPKQVASEIADADNRFMLAVTPEGALVGYIKVRLTRANEEIPECVLSAAVETAELSRLYVDRNFHGSGLADRLMTAALGIAREADRDVCWLGVYENNERARRFYARCGFTEIGEHHFQFATNLQTDKVMSRAINNWNNKGL